MAGPAISVARAALTCRCPRCGEGRLYAGVLRLQDRCAVCGLGFGDSDTGDGGAFAAIFVLSILIVVLAFWVEFTFSPPFWVHLVIWPIVTVPAAILLMRPAKAALVALQYRTRSREMGL